MSECSYKPRVYWLSCLAVIGGWLTATVQGLFVVLSIDFTSDVHRSVIAKQDWEKRFVQYLLNMIMTFN